MLQQGYPRGNLKAGLPAAASVPVRADQALPQGGGPKRQLRIFLSIPPLKLLLDVLCSQSAVKTQAQKLEDLEDSRKTEERVI